ncbi:hypothetical protein [Oceanisphaera avium]|nr:hypothetical protein [Oceanisphaera avium]
MSALIVIMITIFISVWVWSERHNSKKMVQLQADLKEKINASIELDPKDIVLLGRAHFLSPANSRTALYRVYQDVKEPEEFKKLKALVSEVEKEEPFDTMPDEVKSSLLRMAYLLTQSGEESDKHVLTPVTNILTKYNELLEEQTASKVKTNRAYLATLVSLVIGVVSIVYAYNAPSASDIAAEVSQIMSEETGS